MRLKEIEFLAQKCRDLSPGWLPTEPFLDVHTLCWKCRGEQGCPRGAGVWCFCRRRKVVLYSLLESGFETLCLIAFAFAPSYEGTGRSLSLKLIQQLRQQSAQSQISTTAENKTTTTARLASGTLELEWALPFMTSNFPVSRQKGSVPEKESCSSSRSSKPVTKWESARAFWWLGPFCPHLRAGLH